MAITMKGAERGQKRGEDNERLLPVSWADKETGEKNVSGLYLVKVLNIRENETDNYGLGFFLDFEVAKAIKGGSKRGACDAFVKFPDNVTGHKKMPKAKARARELGKIQVAIAAVLGRTASEADIVDDDRYASALADGDTPSPLAGRYFIIEAVPYVGKNGKTVYYECLPATDEDLEAAGLAQPKEGERPAVKAEEAEEAAAKKAPALPGKKGPKLPEGWAVHPDDADYVFNEETEEVIELEKLKARLAA